MTIASYVKKQPTFSENRNKKSPAKSLKIISGILITSGLLLIASVIWPLASYQFFTAPSLQPKEFLAPVPVLGRELRNTENEASEASTENQEILAPEKWFPEAEYNRNLQSKITHYTLSIPKLDIDRAVVEIGGEDLSQSLIHYPGTALPGELGASIIFGHSVLPQFFNPQNYMAIFSLIPTLELGDEILIKFDGISYTYRVIDKVEVKPTNLSVLEQPYDNEYLRLITCTPPGTYLRRGVITAALVD